MIELSTKCYKCTKLPTLPICVTRMRTRSAKACTMISVGTPSRSTDLECILSMMVIDSDEMFKIDAQLSSICSVNAIMYPDVRNSPSKGKAKQDARYWQPHWWDFHPLAEHLQRLLFPESSLQLFSNFHLLQDPSRGLLRQQYSLPTLLNL